MGSKRKSLDQELAELYNPAPASEHDPDALDLGDDAKLASDDEYEEARRAPSRRAPEKPMLIRGDIVLEDAAYRGRKSSRAALFGDGMEAGDDDDTDMDDDDENVDLDLDDDEEEGSSEGDEDELDGAERLAAAGRAGPSGRRTAAAAAAGNGLKPGAAKRAAQLANGDADSSGEGEEDDVAADGEAEDSDDSLASGSGSDLEQELEEASGSGEGDEGEEEEELQIAAQKKAVKQPRSGAGAGGELEELEAEYQALEEEDAKQLEALRQKGEKDRAKGMAVRNQQVLYERSLEQRILLQKCLQASNGLPRPNTHAALVLAEPDIREGYTQLATAARETLTQMLELQHTLMGRNEAITVPPQAAADIPATSGRGGAKRRRADANGGGAGGEAGDGLGLLWERISSHHAALAPFRDVSLDSWHRRTVLSSGSGALRNSGLRALNQSVSNQVEALMRDPAKFIKRTRLTVSACPRVLCEPQRAEAAADPLGIEADLLGPSQHQQGDGPAAAATAAARYGTSSSVAADLAEEERDAETYDDSEFYQQLLKEFLDKGLSGGAAAGAPRAPKKRKQVDRRASKGRKLRFHVQEKLVAFMAPVDLESPPFAANLFSNLFGHAGK